MNYFVDDFSLLTWTKKVMMGKECSANTLPIISINYSNLLKGLRKLQSGSEEFER